MTGSICELLHCDLGSCPSFLLVLLDPWNSKLLDPFRWPLFPTVRMNQARLLELEPNFWFVISI